MKHKYFGGQWSIAALTASVMLVAACNEVDVPTPVPEEQTGNIDIVLPGSADGKGGWGTSANPAVAEQGDTLNFAITQKSSYTDLDGSVFTCEPKAVITLMAEQDTVYVKDIESLMKTIGEPTIVNSTTGTNPMVYSTVQSFSIGGQDIKFDLAYEVYKYTNKAEQTFDMPYIRLNPATLGDATHEKTRTIKPAITLKKIEDKTRSIIETDTTMFEVTARFALGIEGINTSSSIAQDLCFEVKYTGVVTEEIVLPDPVNAVTCSVDGAEKPYIGTYASPLKLSVVEESSHTTSYGEVYKNFLEANISLSVANEKIIVDKKDDISDFEAKVSENKQESENSVCADYVFELGNQTVNINTTYLIPSANEEYDIAYMKFGAVKFVKIESITKCADEPETYQVRAMFEVDLESVDASESTKMTIPFFAEYIAEIKEAELLKVIYRQSSLWLEPHDNLELRHFHFVYRDKYYTNGTMLTDTIHSNIPIDQEVRWKGGGFFGYGVSYGDRTGQEFKYPWEDGTYFLGKSWETLYTDSVTAYAEAKVPDISKITVTPEQRDQYDTPCFSQMTPDDYHIYCHIPDSYNLPEPIEPSTQGFAETDLETGWYYKVCFINKPEEPIRFSLAYNNQGFSIVPSFISCHVFFLVIDHKIIQFEEWKPKDFKSDFSLRTEGDKVYVSCYSSAIFLERFFSGRTEIVISKLE